MGAERNRRARKRPANDHGEQRNQQHRQLDVGHPRGELAKVGHEEPERVEIAEAAIAGRQRGLVEMCIQPGDADDRRQHAQSKSQCRANACPPAVPPVSQQEPAGDDEGEQDQVRTNRQRDGSSQSARHRQAGRRQRQRQRPRRGDRHVAHRVHQLIQEHRTARDQDGAGERDTRRSEHPTAQRVRAPDGEPAAQRHDQERATETERNLEQRHQKRQAWRIDRNDGSANPRRRTVPERRPGVNRQWPRRRAYHVLLVRRQLTAKQQRRLADVAVGIRSAGDQGPPVQAREHDEAGQRRRDQRRRQRHTLPTDHGFR